MNENARSDIRKAVEVYEELKNAHIASLMADAERVLLQRQFDHNYAIEVARGNIIGRNEDERRGGYYIEHQKEVQQLEEAISKAFVAKAELINRQYRRDAALIELRILELYKGEKDDSDETI